MIRLDQCRLSRWPAALALALLTAAEDVAPYNGAPFLRPASLASLPSNLVNERNPNLEVQRLIPNEINKKGPDSCSMGNQADKGACLGNPDRPCMWVSKESNNPLLPVQAVESYCLPCEIDGMEQPCWNVNAWVGGMRVTACEMTCSHQTKIRQPEYACSDESGFITTSQCFDKGVRSGSKCMWLAYEKDDGTKKSTCGPCFISGTGGFGCPAAGGPGPESGSKITSCVDQCAVICPGPPGCPPTAVPPPPPPPPSPGVVQTAASPDSMLIAPAPVAMPTINPYAVAQAAMEAAKKAGWEIGTTPLPKSYDPVLMYRGPMDYMFTPGPPAAMIAAPAPPGAFLQKSMLRKDDKAVLPKLRRLLLKQ
jgi:hypothetical protein